MGGAGPQLQGSHPEGLKILRTMKNRRNSERCRIKEKRRDRRSNIRRSNQRRNKTKKSSKTVALGEASEGGAPEEGASKLGAAKGEDIYHEI